ncbi:AraC-like DNA-binding protein [Mucilaginibacter gracilis]|uniref:AraC-like DNA-binding protein n=1 Tax=Mucilaginibacter gracilis TaxID=423350 RepID=A0A495IWD8_9SPHI|nr:AraC family transcriptional regulator [Mucilaginibacter gracilis]RKR81067.1 AraC-like DNA-binding protein [Mucilaginibacter gracilis]
MLNILINENIGLPYNSYNVGLKKMHNDAFFTRWKNVNLSRVAPFIYLRYYERHSTVYEKQSTVSGLTTKGYFYLNNEFAACEVFVEKVQEGFWMIAMEIRSKENIHYYITPKHKTNFYSANFISSSTEIGYQNGKDIHWDSTQVLFFDPSTSHEIYLKKGTRVKCSRLIYTNNFLNALAGSEINFSSEKGQFNQTISNRTMVKAEDFLQDRLFNILRYERNEYHYRASLFSAAYGLTTFFLKLLSGKKEIMNDLNKKDNYAMLKAAKILEVHFSDRFPGIHKLAFDCNISVSKLKRDFKKIYGITPLNYFRNLQVTYAMVSYKEREKTAKELAADLGFKKSSNFSAWYKNINDHQNYITKS